MWKANRQVCIRGGSEAFSCVRAAKLNCIQWLILITANVSCSNDRKDMAILDSKPFCMMMKTIVSPPVITNCVRAMRLCSARMRNECELT